MGLLLQQKRRRKEGKCAELNSDRTYAAGRSRFLSLFIFDKTLLLSSNICHFHQCDDNKEINTALPSAPDRPVERGEHIKKVSTFSTPQRLPLGEMEESTVFAPYQAFKRSSSSSEYFLMLNTLSFANTRASRLYSFSSCH